jgi:REP element-mobilizing transposase RayT
MPRGLRPEQPGGFFHIVGKAIRDEPLFRSDCDRALFLLGLREVITHYGWSCLTYCLMSTHYHFVVQTPEPNLADGMQRLNGRYAESFNRRHRLKGHAFGARYWSEPIQRDAHVLEAMRYVVLNPVRGGIVDRPEDWRWSSHHALARGVRRTWLAADDALALFGGRSELYVAFVESALTARAGAR